MLDDGDPGYRLLLQIDRGEGEVAAGDFAQQVRLILGQLGQHKHCAIPPEDDRIDGRRLLWPYGQAEVVGAGLGVGQDVLYGSVFLTFFANLFDFFQDTVDGLVDRPALAGLLGDDRLKVGRGLVQVSGPEILDLVRVTSDLCLHAFPSCGGLFLWIVIFFWHGWRR